MRLAITGLLGLALCAAPAAAMSQRAARRPNRRQTAAREAYLPKGYYFELTPCARCHRCAPCAMPDGWQKDTLADLRGGGVSAFLAAPYQMNRAEIVGVKRLRRILGYNTSIYVGPYESEQAAKRSYKRLCEVASDFGGGCRDWPGGEYSVSFSNGIWASLNYVPSPDK
jgi:putative hemolysin